MQPSAAPILVLSPCSILSNRAPFPLALFLRSSHHVNYILRPQSLRITVRRTLNRIAKCLPRRQLCAASSHFSTRGSSRTSAVHCLAAAPRRSFLLSFAWRCDGIFISRVTCLCNTTLKLCTNVRVRTTIICLCNQSPLK